MTGRRKVVVVGVDGSPNSVVALRRGAAEAAKDGARLRAVHVRRTADDDGAGILEGAASEAFGQHIADHIGVDVELVERVGGAHEVLLKEAANAEVLVVGAHGQTGAFRVALGTTAQFCADHAQCAVLVVPPADRGASPADQVVPPDDRVVPAD
jgi:nucleotide-binding universal stress UspA family protein